MSIPETPKFQTRPTDTRYEKEKYAAADNPADLATGEISLPVFISQHDGRIWLDPMSMESPEALFAFIDHVFSVGACLVDVDLVSLSRLMYPRTPPGGTPPSLPTAAIAIARTIRLIPAERQALYKAIKIDSSGKSAQYVFEPVHIERLIEEPVYGEINESGERPITGVETKVIQEAAHLDADEFIAMMWQKGLRAGLDLKLICSTIATPGVHRVDIAHSIEPEDGVDATLTEQSKALRRDDSPRLLPNGKIDLCHFKNRFPQISAGEQLLKKIPRKFGLLGINLNGTLVEPPVPRDYKLEEIAGPGTRVERTNNGEFVVSVRDGFLDIDAQSSEISVTDMIVNRGGISARTTGDLSLSGDQYEEHGEVQERRSVEGKNMTFHADVFGRIVSSGGKVVLKSNLTGGEIESRGGQVCVEGRTSQAVLEALHGSVEIAYAETCTIIADRVTVKLAIGCTIVAEEVVIEESSACAVAARRISIGRSDGRKGVDTLILIAVPDLSAIDQELAETRKRISELEGKIVHKQAEINKVDSEPALKRYLDIEASVRSGKLKLNTEQVVQLRRMMQTLAQPLQHLRDLHKEIESVKASIATEMEEITAIQKRRIASGTSMACNISAVVGATTVRTLPVRPDSTILAGSSPSEIRQTLRALKGAKEILFSGEEGAFSWQYSRPEGE